MSYLFKQLKLEFFLLFLISFILPFSIQAEEGKGKLSPVISQLEASAKLSGEKISDGNFKQAELISNRNLKVLKELKLLFMPLKERLEDLLKREKGIQQQTIKLVKEKSPVTDQIKSAQIENLRRTNLALEWLERVISQQQRKAADPKIQAQNKNLTRIQSLVKEAEKFEQKALAALNFNPVEAVVPEKEAVKKLEEALKQQKKSDKKSDQKNKQNKQQTNQKQQKKSDQKNKQNQQQNKQKNQNSNRIKQNPKSAAKKAKSPEQVKSREAAKKLVKIRKQAQKELRGRIQKYGKKEEGEEIRVDRDW